MKFFVVFIILSTLSPMTILAQSSNEDIDLSALMAEPDPAQQELMTTMASRRTMLDWHNYTGWAAMALMIATVATAPKEEASNTHKWMGIAAGTTYATSALLSYLAPRPSGIKDSKSISWHKKLIYVHAPAMLLSMITGFAIHNDRKNGRAPGTFAKSHKPFSSIATVAMGLSLGVTLYEF